MSGPKYSHALIERYRAEQLLKAEQERLELEKKNRLIADIKNANNSLQQQIKDFQKEDYLRHLDKLHLANIDSAEVSELEKAIKSILEFQILDIPYSESSDVLSLAYAKCKEAKVMVSGSIATVKMLDNRLKSVYEQARTTRKEQQFQEADWASIKKHQYQTVSPKLLEEYHQALLAAKNVAAPTEYLTIIQNIFQNEYLDDEYKIRELRMRRQAVVTEHQIDQHTIIAAQTEYESLCTLLGKSADELPQDKNVLHQQIELMKKELEQHTLAEYVGAALKESMAELGYSVCDTTTLATRTRTIEKKEFDYTPNSFVNVASSTDGTVMFEVVGKSCANASKSDICQDMQRFCPDYPKVKEKLKERGIILTDEKLYPPSEEYVRFVDTTWKSDNRRASTQKRKKMYIDG